MLFCIGTTYGAPKTEETTKQQQQRWQKRKLEHSWEKGVHLV